MLIAEPEGLVNITCSPSALILKLVCKGASGLVRFFPDVHTIRYSPG